LYVIEVDDPRNVKKIEFYVGSTKESPEKRWATHARGGLYGSRLFKTPGVKLGPLRHDLYDGLPKFRCHACAENAEGRLARVITAQLGKAHSDQLGNRIQQKVLPCEGRKQ